MKLLLICLLLSISSVTLSQSKNTPIGFGAEDNLRALGTSRTANQVQLFNNRYQGVRGTPFLNDRWYQAEVVLTRGDTVFTLLKLDVYSDDVWAILSEGDSIIVDKGLIKSFSFIDETIQRKRTFFFDLYNTLGYFEMLFEGKHLSLACKRKKELIKAVISGAYTTGEPYDEFLESSSEFYVVANGRLKRLRKKGDISNILGKNAKAFAEGNHLDLKNEDHVLELVMQADKAAAVE